MAEVNLLFPKVRKIRGVGSTVRYYEEEPPAVRFFDGDDIPEPKKLSLATREAKVFPVTEIRGGEIVTEYFAFSHELERLASRAIQGARFHALHAEDERQAMRATLSHVSMQNQALRDELSQIKSRSAWWFLKEAVIRAITGRFKDRRM